MDRCSTHVAAIREDELEAPGAAAWHGAELEDAAVCKVHRDPNAQLWARHQQLPQLPTSSHVLQRRQIDGGKIIWTTSAAGSLPTAYSSWNGILSTAAK
jgi:hypothetical protein